MLRQRQVVAATSVVESLPAVLDSVDRSVSQARVALAAREAERSSQNEELVALRVSESSLRERLDIVGDDVHGLEMQLYEKKLQLSTLLERAGEELGLVEDVLVAEYGPHVPVPADEELTHTAAPEPVDEPPTLQALHPRRAGGSGWPSPTASSLSSVASTRSRSRSSRPSSSVTSS